MDSSAVAETSAKISAGPRQVVTCGETTFTLLGTAHVSRASAEEVRTEIESGAYDRVAIELCDARHQALTQRDAMEQMDLFQVLRQGKAGMVAANLALGAYQQRLAEQFDIEPGAEMRAAIEASDEASLPLLLVDRNIGVTLKRVYRSIPWWQRLGTMAALFGSLLSSDKIEEEDIEKLKQGDVLEATFNEFAESSAALHEALIDERDRYMASRLLQQADVGGNTLVVIGAGHLKGLTRYLQQPLPEPAAEQKRLDVVPPGARWVKWIPWVVLVLVLGGFVWGFMRSPGLGGQLILEWILFHGVLSAAGATIALAHPLSIATAFVAAPLTALHPLIGAGMVVASVELWIRKPRVGDFSTLKQDVTHVSGWWRNRISRTLLVFMLSSFGSALGTWIAGARIISALF